MTRPALYLACCLLLASWHGGFAAEALVETPRPIVEIEWRGQANMGQDEFLELIGIQVGDTLQRDAVRRSLERLYLKGFFSQVRLDAFRQFYAEQGFPQAKVSWRAEPSADQTRVTIVLDIDEGPPLLVTELKFEGVTAWSVDDLLARFKVRVGQPLNTERLSGDLERLQERYRRAGYRPMRNDGPHVQRDPEGHTAAVSITVIEGPKLTLEFTGNRRLSRKVLEPA